MSNHGNLHGLWLTLTGVLLIANPILATWAGSELESPQVSTPPTEIRAYLVPRTHTSLSAQIDAQIDRLTVKEGDTFAEGAPLIHFDCTTLLAQKNKTQAALLAAQDKNKVMQRLAELHSVGTLEADASRSEQNQAAADVKLQESRLRGCQIRAPFAGRVASLLVQPHQYISTGQVIMKILDHRHLEMEMIVPSRWLAWLKPKKQFSMLIDETGKNYPAQVIRLGAEADPVSQSIKIVGELIGDHPELMPGMSGAAAFMTPDDEKQSPRQANETSSSQPGNTPQNTKATPLAPSKRID